MSAFLTQQDSKHPAQLDVPNWQYHAILDLDGSQNLTSVCAIYADYKFVPEC